MAIRKQLEKKFDVVDFDYGIRRFYTLLNKCFCKLMKRTFDFSNFYTHIFARKYKGENIIFQYSETPFVYSGKNKHFIYQDLSWNIAKDLKELNYKIFKISSFRQFDECTIKDNIKKQNLFYSHDNVYCMTMSKWLAKYLVENMHLPSERVCYVGGGENIDISKVDMSKKTGNKFLFVGKDFERKNGPLVVEAFKKLRSGNKSYELYIAGIKKDNIKGDGIHNLGLLSFDQLIKYFNLCDVFVMPSLFEAYGLVFNEALSFGLPCIGYNAYEMPYLIDDEIDGYLLKTNDANELAILMKKAIENKEMINYVKTNNEQYIKRCSWNSVVDRMTLFINSKLSKNSDK